MNAGSGPPDSTRRAPAEAQKALAASLQLIEGALSAGEQRSRRWRAWRELQAGSAQGEQAPEPYTPQAISLLEAAYGADESDSDVLHDLAIAYHAMAWDLELAGSAQATDAWEQALYYWGKLRAAQPFWERLAARGAALGPEFDRKALELFRSNLIQYLLEVHLDFIRHYWELGQRGEAMRHIELIRRARIPPASRRRLEQIAYADLAASLGQLAGESRFADLLSILDDFLELFPTCGPALQQYLEAANLWVDQLSPTDDWSTLLGVAQRAQPKWGRLHELGPLPALPLAQGALATLAATLGAKYRARVTSIWRQRGQPTPSPSQRLKAYELCGDAVAWFRRALELASNTGRAQDDLAHMLLTHASIAAEIAFHDADWEAATTLFEQAIGSCEDAGRAAPGDSAASEVAAQILQDKAAHRLRHLPAGMSDRDFVGALREAEQDLLRALRFDPNSELARDQLASIRGTLDEQASEM